MRAKRACVALALRLRFGRSPLKSVNWTDLPLRGWASLHWTISLP